jgi:hypothetical protein
MGCTQGAEVDRNIATSNVSANSAIIEAEKAVAYVVKGMHPRFVVFLY